MNPRLESSVKWTPFPEDLALQIHEVLTERFSEEFDLKSSSFIVQGRIYSQEILLRVGLNSSKRLRQPNFEFSLEYDSKNEKAIDKIYQSLDFIGQLWEDFLEEDMDDSELPQEWQVTASPKGFSAFLRYSTINTELEKQADVLLQQYEKKLVYEDAETAPEETHPDIPLTPRSNEIH